MGGACMHVCPCAGQVHVAGQLHAHVRRLPVLPGWLCGGRLSLRCRLPSSWPTAATPRDIRLRQERQQGAAQQHEDGLKSWDPTKDPNVAVSVCA